MRWCSCTSTSDTGRRHGRCESSRDSSVSASAGGSRTVRFSLGAAELRYWNAAVPGLGGRLLDLRRLGRRRLDSRAGHDVPGPEGVGEPKTQLRLANWWAGSSSPHAESAVSAGACSRCANDRHSRSPSESPSPRGHRAPAHKRGFTGFGDDPNRSRALRRSALAASGHRRLAPANEDRWSGRPKGPRPGAGSSSRTRPECGEGRRRAGCRRSGCHVAGWPTSMVHRQKVLDASQVGNQSASSFHQPQLIFVAVAFLCSFPVAFSQSPARLASRTRTRRVVGILRRTTTTNSPSMPHSVSSPGMSITTERCKPARRPMIGRTEECPIAIPSRLIAGCQVHKTRGAKAERIWSIVGGVGAWLLDVFGVLWLLLGLVRA